MKKAKLFLSLCMMCLCIAVLCMGILAAGSATYNINGNISYNMIDGVSLINTRVYKVAYDGSSTVSTLKTEMESRISTLASMKLSEIEANQDPIYVLSEKKDYLKYSDSAVTAEDKVSIIYGKSTDDESTYYMYFVVINITNLSTDTAYCLNAKINETLSNTTTSYVSTNQSQSEIASGSFANIVIGFSAMSTSYSSTSEDFTYTLTVSYEKLPLRVNIDYSLASGYTATMTTTRYTESTSYLASNKQASTFRTRAKNIQSGSVSLSNGTTIGTYTASTTGIKVPTTYDDSVKVNWIVCSIKNTSSSSIYVKLIEDRELDFFTSGSFIYRSADVTSLSSGSTTKVVIGYTYNGLNTSTESVECGYTIEIGYYSNYAPIKKQEEQTLTTVDLETTYTKSAYYYVEMGDFYGMPVRWRMIAEKGGTTGNAGVYAFNGTNYTHKEGTITSGTTNRIFIQETYTSMVTTQKLNKTWSQKGYTERSDNYGLTECSFNNYGSGSGDQNYYKYDESGSITSYKANDYYNSKIRSYLKGTNVGKRSTGSSNSSSGHTSNYLTDLNIVSGGLGYSNIYSNIVNRTSMGMATGKFKSSVWTTSGTDSDYYYGDYGSGKTTSDKFWLLSVEELLTWLAGKTTSTTWAGTEMYNLVNWGYSSYTNWQGGKMWLRSGLASDSDLSYIVKGDGYNGNLYVYYGNAAARAAFQLYCKA